MSIHDTFDNPRTLWLDDSDPERYPMQDPDDIAEADDEGFDDDDEEDDDEEDENDDRDE